MMTSRDLVAALAQKAGFELVTEKESARQYRMTGRCHPSRWNFLLPVIFQLLLDAETPGAWKVDVSRQYILLNKRVVYCWRFIFEHEDLKHEFESIVRSIRAAPQPARVEVNEVLLPGYKAGDVRGGVNARGKGVAAAGSAPMILNRK